MFFNIHGKSSKHLQYEVKTNLVQGFTFYVTIFGGGKRACRFLNNTNLQIRRFVKKTTVCRIVVTLTDTESDLIYYLMEFSVRKHTVEHIWYKF